MIAETSSSTLFSAADSLTKKRPGAESLSSTSLPPSKRVKTNDRDDEELERKQEQEEDRRMKESELERKRWASRESSRRTRERERHRFDYFAGAKAKLEKANADLKNENQRCRLLIDLIKRSKALTKAAATAPLVGQPLSQPPAILNPSTSPPSRSNIVQPPQNKRYSSIPFPAATTPPNLQSLLLQALAGNPTESLTSQPQHQSTSQRALAYLAGLQADGAWPLGGTPSTIQPKPSSVMTNKQSNLFNAFPSLLASINQQQQQQFGTTNQTSPFLRRGESPIVECLSRKGNAASSSQRGMMLGVSAPNGGTRSWI
eukprot:Nitzschia sp. Nitz4//scaffold72_size95085//49170//50117//NITZ4_004762-RA/size95085-processed-gene-0.28-mRNA-1//-1//CDS//3329557381//6361//frame0